MAGDEILSKAAERRRGKRVAGAGGNRRWRAVAADWGGRSTEEWIGLVWTGGWVCDIFFTY